MQKEHFFLGNQIAEPRSFTPRAKVVPPPVIPERNRQEHAAFIKESYNAVVEYAITALSEREKCSTFSHQELTDADKCDLSESPLTLGILATSMFGTFSSAKRSFISFQLLLFVIALTSR